ncbi:hypothetical protein BGX28_004906 [Mortierella sp. GBA30]|nr:hypothetical protein BGX28_004906 [Mortierella sp. GBA30]
MLMSSEPKVRRLLIHVDTGLTIGPRTLPLIYGNHDAPTLLHAAVTFESSHDCRAKAIEILFKAAVKTMYFYIYYMGQIVPMTVRLAPFLAGSAFEGESAEVIGLTFTFRETKTFRAMFVRDIHETQEKLLSIPVNTDWPKSVDGWQRTISVSLPSSPAMSTDMHTKYLDITHSIEIVLEFRTGKMSKPEKLRGLLDIQITAPRFSSAEPPLYGAAVPVESVLLLESPRLMDMQETLPGYSRYE